MADWLTVDEGRRLVALARAAIAARLEGERLAVPEDLPAALYARGAAFVTLRQRTGELRGCIGSLAADRGLATCVVENAGRAALQDPRFEPVTEAELPLLHVEVSCLTPTQPVAAPDAIAVGRHGVVLELHGRRAVFLPQVATEQGWNREQLLDALARKAGLASDAWRLSAARFQVFEAQVVAEE